MSETKKTIVERIKEAPEFTKKKLIMSVGGYSVSEAGNMTLQTIIENKRYQVVLGLENDKLTTEQKESELEKLLDRKVAINSVYVQETRNEKGFIEESFYSAIWNESNIKDLGNYEKDATMNGVFLFLIESEPLNVRDVREVEIPIWKDGKKTGSKKQVEVNLFERVKGKMTNHVYIYEDRKLEELTPFLNKRVIIRDIEKRGSQHNPKYYAHQLPEIQSTTSQKTATTKSNTTAKEN